MLRHAVDVLGALPNVTTYLDGTHSAWLGVGDIAHRLRRREWQPPTASTSTSPTTSSPPTARTTAAGSRPASRSPPTRRTTSSSPARTSTGTEVRCPPRSPSSSGSGPVWRSAPFGEWSADADDPALNTSGIDLRYGTMLGAVEPTAHYVIDTSRNGRGPWRPPAYPDPQDWCNPPDRGVGLPPTLDTGEPLVDAYLWVKIPGESDGECTRGLGPAGETVDPVWGRSIQLPVTGSRRWRCEWRPTPTRRSALTPRRRSGPVCDHALDRVAAAAARGVEREEPWVHTVSSALSVLGLIGATALVVPATAQDRRESADPVRGCLAGDRVQRHRRRRRLPESSSTRRNGRSSRSSGRTAGRIVDFDVKGQSPGLRPDESSSPRAASHRSPSCRSRSSNSLFPEGDYRFEGVTIDGLPGWSRTCRSRTPFLDAPQFIQPQDGVRCPPTPPSSSGRRWRERPSYEVIVTREDPLRVMDIPAGAGGHEPDRSPRSSSTSGCRVPDRGGTRPPSAATAPSPRSASPSADAFSTPVPESDRPRGA